MTDPIISHKSQEGAFTAAEMAFLKAPTFQNPERTMGVVIAEFMELALSTHNDRIIEAVTQAWFDYCTFEYPHLSSIQFGFAR
jgi:hypothetical protein